MPFLVNNKRYAIAAEYSPFDLARDGYSYPVEAIIVPAMLGSQFEVFLSFPYDLVTLT
jgi:hypothetical protein